MIQLITPFPWTAKQLADMEAVDTIRIDVEGDTEELIRMLGNLVRYWGGRMTLEPLPNGQYDLIVPRHDAALVIKHLEREKVAAPADLEAEPWTSDEILRREG